MLGKGFQLWFLCQHVFAEVNVWNSVAVPDIGRKCVSYFRKELLAIGRW